MKKRYVYTLLWLIPGFFIAALVTSALFAAVYGALWLFVYGDTVWPAWTQQSLPVVMLTVFLCLWLGIAAAGHAFGKRLEGRPGMNVRHVWLALGATLLPVMIIALHQLSVGNLGPKSAITVCRDYCVDRGYDTSGTSPRNLGNQTCQCFGPRGETEVTVPLDALSR